MADEPAHKSVKTGVKAGSGRPPGYLWNVDVLNRSFDEAKSFLDDDQYDHLAEQVRELARQDDPTHSEIVDVKPIEDFYEISDKGGVLKKLSVRVFFCVHKESRTIVVLGTMKKENNGPTPQAEKITMRRRRRHYLENYHPDS